MARAKRHYIPNGHYIWHITHRCHKKEFLHKFNKDKRVWLKWLHQAKKIHHVKILNYVITSNHIHLLVLDDAPQGTIAKTMHLVAGATAQRFNRRKKRCGAFWQDRYHATAVDGGRYLKQCLTYIDLNPVRAGIVHHPEDWPFSGYAELMRRKTRYRLIDEPELLKLLRLSSPERHLSLRQEWVKDMLKLESGLKRESIWTESIAVGSQYFSEKLKAGLEDKGIGKTVVGHNGTFSLRDDMAPYFIQKNQSRRR